MQSVAAGEYSGHLGHELRVADGAARVTVKLDSETLRQLVFRDKSDGNYERVAFYSLGAVGYGLIIFIDLADLNGLEAVSAENSRDRMAQVQGDFS